MADLQQTKAAPARQHGRVKVYWVSKGFGFITAHDGAEWFFHMSECRGDIPRDGALVAFDVGKRRGREQALRVCLDRP